MKIKQADGVDVFRCDGCGALHIVFYDANDRPFAEVSMHEGDALGFGEHVIAICDEIADEMMEGDGPADSIGPTAGTA